MNKEYYKKYYEFERFHWWFRARNNILKVLIRKYFPTSTYSQPRILNIGVATGGSTNLLKEFGNVTSVEYDKDCCVFLEEKLGIKTVNASILELPFEDNYFDLVCAFDVIEHVDDDYKAVHEMSRVVKNGGIVIITVPAFMFLWSNHDKINHHYRRYTLSVLLNLLTNSDLVVLFKSYFNFFLFFPIASFRVLVSKFIFNKENNASDFEINANSNFINSILFRVFDTEKYILNKISLPIGVSISLILRKSS